AKPLQSFVVVFIVVVTSVPNPNHHRPGPTTPGGGQARAQVPVRVAAGPANRQSVPSGGLSGALRNGTTEATEGPGAMPDCARRARCRPEHGRAEDTRRSHDGDQHAR